MEIAWSKTRKSFPLSDKKIIKKTLINGLGWAALILVGHVAAWFTLKSNGADRWLLPATAAAMLILAIFLNLSYQFQKWYFAVYFYDLTDDYVVIRKGPITPHEITIPYERIQDVYVDQDLLDRFFGLYDVHLSSATASSGLEAHIDGVDKVGMEGLREILLETVKNRISKAKKV